MTNQLNYCTGTFYIGSSEYLMAKNIYTMGYTMSDDEIIDVLKEINLSMPTSELIVKPIYSFQVPCPATIYREVGRHFTQNYIQNVWQEAGKKIWYRLPPEDLNDVKKLIKNYIDHYYTKPSLVVADPENDHHYYDHYNAGFETSTATATDDDSTTSSMASSISTTTPNTTLLTLDEAISNLLEVERWKAISPDRKLSHVEICNMFNIDVKKDFRNAFLWKVTITREFIVDMVLLKWCGYSGSDSTLRSQFMALLQQHSYIPYLEVNTKNTYAVMSTSDFDFLLTRMNTLKAHRIRDTYRFLKQISIRYAEYEKYFK